ENEPAGEGRLVFAVTTGAGDDPSADALAMSVIFEYRLPTTRSLGAWATAWHELGQYTTFDEPFRAALEGVTNAFTKRGVSPETRTPSGSALAQVRTNEKVLGWRWQLREFAFNGGTLESRALRNTPSQQMNNSAALRDFVVANSAAIR